MNEIDAIRRDLERLERMVAALEVPGEPSRGRDIDRALDAVAAQGRELRELKAQAGARDKALADEVASRILATVTKRIKADGAALADALVEVLKELRIETDRATAAGVSAVQSSAELARSLSRQQVESAAEILRSASYFFSRAS